MEETDFPNDVLSTELLIDSQLKERAEILNTVLSTRRYIILLFSYFKIIFY